MEYIFCRVMYVKATLGSIFSNGNTGLMCYEMFKNIFVYPGYNEKFYDHDIGLIRLQRPVQFSSKYR